MTFVGAGAAGNFPHPLGSRARVLAKQEETAAAAAGKVGVAPLPPLAWGLRIPARTWERWSHLGGRRGATRTDCSPSSWCPPMAPLGPRQERRKWRRAAQWAVLSLLAPSFSLPPSVGQQEGQTFKIDHKIHLLTQPMYLQAQRHVKPASLPHPFPAHRQADRFVGERALDRRKDASGLLEKGPGPGLNE